MTSHQLAIREAITADDFDTARTLFLEYAQWLKIDLCFQGFNEELATLPGNYAPPSGRCHLDLFQIQISRAAASAASVSARPA